jgi:hypothetical protein
MDAPITPPFLSRQDAIASVVAALATLGARAIERDRDLALAVSSRVAPDALGRGLASALSAHPALQSRLHLFAADLGIDSAAPARARFSDLRSGLGLHPKQLHLPGEGDDVLRSARAFETEVRSFFRLSPSQLPVFDLCCLAPEDLGAPRWADASHRIATGGYDASTARCSVSLTLASLCTSRRVVSLGPRSRTSRPSKLPAAMHSRLERLHWTHEFAAHAAGPKEMTS